MPLYDYLCQDCGVFSAFARLNAYNEPQPCPHCQSASPRVMLSAPGLATMNGGMRRAHETNERSADSPRRSNHGPGCSCCGGGAKKSSALVHPDGSKSFPTKRPWMISH